MLSHDVEAYDEYCERTQPSDDYAGPREATAVDAIFARLSARERVVSALVSHIADDAAVAQVLELVDAYAKAVA